MASFVNVVLGNLGEREKDRLGKGGTKINEDGEHLLTITNAFEIENRFVLEAEDELGKKIDATLFLTAKVGKNADGTVKAGKYFVNGIETQLDTEGAEYDNLRAIGQIKNLWKICGLPEADFGSGIEPGTITYSKAGTKDIDVWKKLIGQQFVGVSSYLITADAADKNKAWRNQELNMNQLFAKDRRSQEEIDAGFPEPVQIDKVVKEAKANAKIKYSDQKNKACMQELQAIKNKGKAPVAEEVDDDDAF
jgi:hypothetical protein